MKRFILGILLFSTAVVAADYAANTVVVSQGTAKLTFADVDTVVKRLPASDRAALMDNPTRIENTLQSMLLVRQLANQAREKGLDKDPKVVAEIAWTTEEKLAASRSEHYLDDVVVPDMEGLAKEKYLANKASYAVPEQRTVRHLLVLIKPDRDEAQAKAIADQLYKEAIAKPDQFNALLMKNSDDDSKNTNQGQIPDALSEKLDKGFVEGVQHLTKVGQISAPVKSQFGWHLIKLESMTSAHTRTFAEVHDEIIAASRKAYLDQKKKDFIDELRNMKLDADPDVVASIRTRYANDAANDVAKKAAAKIK
jgi:peptidyl-prolyl cis-trans isomerase C